MTLASAPSPDAGLKIRSATPADATAIWRIYNQGIEDRVATFAEGLCPLEEVEAWLQDAGSLTLVAESFRQPVGWASLKPYREGAAFARIAEMSIYIDRAWRRHAVGRLLSGALLEQARVCGLEKLVGYLLEHNISSRKLVEKLGFREVGVHYRHGRSCGAALNVVVVEKLL